MLDPFSAMSTLYKKNLLQILKGFNRVIVELVLIKNMKFEFPVPEGSVSGIW